MKFTTCPDCGTAVPPKNPFPTVDIIIEIEGKGIVLIRRKNPPYGWAIPGGFVDYGESIENAAVREALEETSLKVELLRQFHVYSSPDRDPRFHTISTVFTARATECIDRSNGVMVKTLRIKIPIKIIKRYFHRKILDD